MTPPVPALFCPHSGNPPPQGTGILTLLTNNTSMRLSPVGCPDLGPGGSMHPVAKHVCLAASLALLSGLPGCRGAKPRPASEAPAGFVVTAEQIQKSGARTVWEALQLTVPVVSFRGATRSGSGQSLRIRRRGRSSLYLNDDPRVFIDQVRIVDPSVLAGMPAGDIAGIIVLSGVDATTYYGTSAGNGVVLIFPQAQTAPPPSGNQEPS